jgi:hypothetical protein
MHQEAGGTQQEGVMTAATDPWSGASRMRKGMDMAIACILPTLAVFSLVLLAMKGVDRL